jgi:enoyl-CoA hydratase
VLRGEGPSFAAGADIGELADSPGTGFMRGRRGRLLAAIQRRATPVVAAVHGYALGGGCELALACDIVVAAESARFGLPETGLGIIPGAGGTQRLVRAIGKAKALDVILAGRRLTGAEAEAAGLAARCVPDDELLETALGIAREIAARAPLAQRLARDAVLRAGDVGLDVGLELERRSFEVARASEDADEGLAAFREKRSPEFRGR